MKRENRAIFYWLSSLVTAGLFTINYNTIQNPIINVMSIGIFGVCVGLYIYNFSKYKKDGGNNYGK